MCFGFTPNEIVTFLWKKGEIPKRVVDFLGKETHSETKSWKSSRISTKKSYNNNGKPWKSSRILRVKTIFSLFIFRFLFQFLYFSCSSFHSFSSFFFIFYLFSVISMFFHFLSFLSFFSFTCGISVSVNYEGATSSMNRV